jgi:hypothetical protein
MSSDPQLDAIFKAIDLNHEYVGFYFFLFFSLQLSLFEDVLTPNIIFFYCFVGIQWDH